MNRWIGMGRLTKDPELQSSGNGVEFCHFSIAIDRAYNKKGEDRKTDFVNCTAFGKQAAFVERYFHKGDGIMVEGRLESNKWVDKDGTNRTSWAITCDRIEFPIGKKSGSGDAPAPSEFADAADDDANIPF